MPETKTDPAKKNNGIRFRQAFDIYLPYILHIGSIEPSKESHKLFDYFIRFKEEHPIPLRLVLAGKAAMDLPEHRDIIHLGMIDKQMKFDAIGGSEFLIDPFRHESLPMAVPESWSLDKAVLVNGESNIMVEQCIRTNGGLWYKNYKTFELNTLFLLENAYRFTGMKAFVETNENPDNIHKRVLIK